MIARIIAWSARNLTLVLIATAFAVVAGIWAVRSLPLDAIPDLSDTQVIVYTEFPGQAPQVVEDQITYPLTTSMLTVPRSKVVRGFSFFGVSFVYVLFEDGTDIYWARSRVLEFLNAAAKRPQVSAGSSSNTASSSIRAVCAHSAFRCQKSAMSSAARRGSMNSHHRCPRARMSYLSMIDRNLSTGPSTHSRRL